MTTAVVVTPRPVLPWWFFLVAGIAWLIFAWIILSFDYRTVWAIAIWTGCALIGMGITTFFASSLFEGAWRWLGYAGAAAAVVIGILCFAWPGQTVKVLAALIGWYLLFKGILDIVTSFAQRDGYDLWWLSLVVGILEIALGLWAISYRGAAVALLVVWVGVTAVFHGITDILLAFQVKKLTD